MEVGPDDACDVSAKKEGKVQVGVGKVECVCDGLQQVCAKSEKVR